MACEQHPSGNGPVETQAPGPSETTALWSHVSDSRHTDSVAGDHTGQHPALGNSTRTTIKTSQDQYSLHHTGAWCIQSVQFQQRLRILCKWRCLCSNLRIWRHQCAHSTASVYESGEADFISGRSLLKHLHEMLSVDKYELCVLPPEEESDTEPDGWGVQSAHIIVEGRRDSRRRNQGAWWLNEIAVEYTRRAMIRQRTLTKRCVRCCPVRRKERRGGGG